MPLRLPGEIAVQPGRGPGPSDRPLAVHVGHGVPGGLPTGILRRAFGRTRREAEITAELAEGRSPKEIAARSGRSPKTVRNQMQAIHDEVGGSSNRELIDALGVFGAVVATTERGASDHANALRFPSP